MRLNTKVRYGLRAIADIAENQAVEGTLQKEIAERQDIPLKYLDTIITGLRNRGLIVSVAGRGSGYKLTKPPSAITVYDVYRAFEPELSLVSCICNTMECERNDVCSARSYWFELNSMIRDNMRSSTLEQIMQGEYSQ